MALYFTNNQYLKTAEEDYEAAELLLGHGYYDQIATLCSVALIKYLKAVLEAIYPNTECVPYFSTEDKIVLLNKIKEKLSDFTVTDEDCYWMDHVYGKANCTDGIHMIMPKHTAVEALQITNKARKLAKEYDREANDKKLYAIFERDDNNSK